MEDDVLEVCKAILRSQWAMKETMQEAIRAINDVRDQIYAVEQRLAALENQTRPEEPQPQQ